MTLQLHDRDRRPGIALIELMRGCLADEHGGTETEAYERLIRFGFGHDDIALALASMFKAAEEFGFSPSIDGACKMLALCSVANIQGKEIAMDDKGVWLK